MTWLYFISKKSLWFSKGRIHGGGMGAKIGPGSPVTAHSNGVGVAVAGAKDMARSEQTGENVRSGGHRAW